MIASAVLSGVGEDGGRGRPGGVVQATNLALRHSVLQEEIGVEEAADASGVQVLYVVLGLCLTGGSATSGTEWLTIAELLVGDVCAMAVAIERRIDCCVADVSTGISWNGVCRRRTTNIAVGASDHNVEVAAVLASIGRSLRSDDSTPQDTFDDCCGRGVLATGARIQGRIALEENVKREATGRGRALRSASTSVVAVIREVS